MAAAVTGTALTLCVLSASSSVQCSVALHSGVWNRLQQALSPCAQGTSLMTNDTLATLPALHKAVKYAEQLLDGKDDEVGCFFPFPLLLLWPIAGRIRQGLSSRQMLV